MHVWYAALITCPHHSSSHPPCFRHSFWSPTTHFHTTTSRRRLFFAFLIVIDFVVVIFVYKTIIWTRMLLRMDGMDSVTASPVIPPYQPFQPNDHPFSSFTSHTSTAKQNYVQFAVIFVEPMETLVNWPLLFVGIWQIMLTKIPV